MNSVSSHICRLTCNLCGYNVPTICGPNHSEMDVKPKQADMEWCLKQGFPYHNWICKYLRLDIPRMPCYALKERLNLCLTAVPTIGSAAQISHRSRARGEEGVRPYVELHHDSNREDAVLYIGELSNSRRLPVSTSSPSLTIKYP